MNQQHIELFKGILNQIHKKGTKEFRTDEIRIYKDCISIWDADSKDWYYLQNDLTWTYDLESENLLRL